MFAIPAISCSLQRLRTRLRAFTAASRRRPGRREVSALGEQIQSCRAGFLRFGQASDQEFTSLARGLSRLNGRLAALRTETGALDAALQDRDDDRAISSAYALYKDSVDLVHANTGIAVSAQEQLSSVEAALSKSCCDRATFERDHLFLRIVTLGIRIEASRLPPESQSVFLNVASAIAETGERIQNCAITAFGRIEAVIAESVAARAELHATEQALQHKARHSIETIERELATLQTALAPCAEQSRAVGELLAAAQPQTLAVITALQHQDIVRQQLEHVSEGFEDLEQHLRTGPASAIEWDYVEHAARIQAAQLNASRSEIDGAGTAVIGGLRALLSTSTAMVERFSAMESAAASALDHSRIAELFATELQELTGIIDQSQQANARTSRLVERITEVIRLFSEEIGRYELDVKIVALNAQIAAARLSAADALNRLAEETSNVSDTNTRVTRELSTNLHANLGKLEAVRQEGAAFLAIVTRERAQLERGLESVGGKLTRLVQRVRSGAVQVRRDFEPVHQDCRALLDGLGFPTLIESTFGPPAQLCRNLAATSATAVGAAAPSGAALAKIKKHQTRYTMRKENATHAAALGDRSAVAAAATEADGIELFADSAASSQGVIPLVPPAAPTDTAPVYPTSPCPPPAAGVPAPDASAVASAPAPVPSPPAAGGSFGDGIELF